MHKLSTDLLFLDDDLATLRIFDVLRALDMIALWPQLDAAAIRAYGQGTQSLYPRLAAAARSAHPFTEHRSTRAGLFRMGQRQTL